MYVLMKWERGIMVVAILEWDVRMRTTGRMGE